MSWRIASCKAKLDDDITAPHTIRTCSVKEPRHLEADFRMNDSRTATPTSHNLGSLDMSPISIPPSDHTVDVQIFDTTFRIINGRPQAFMDPAINGFDRMNALAFSFLITHRDASNGKERRLIFDLGAPKDWKNDLPPSVADSVRKWEKAGIRIECEKYVSEILEEHGIPLGSIEGVIWR